MTWNTEIGSDSLPPLGPEDGNGNDARRLRYATYALVIAVSSAALLADLLTIEPPMQSANDRSRWCTVWSLVHRGTYTIDEIIRVPGWDTIDKVRKDGHFYSSKPALLPTLIAGLYWGLHRGFGFDLVKFPRETISLLLLCVNWLPWLAAQCVFARTVERLAARDFTRVLLVFAFSWGTLLTPFQATLNNHTIAAVCLIFAIAPVLGILQGEPGRAGRLAVSGFFAALAVCNELPAFVFGLALCLLLLWRSPRGTVLGFGPAALVPLVAFFVTTRICTGGFKPFQTEYGTDIYRYVFEGVPSYWINPAGIDQSRESPAVYLLHCTVGHHGWLSLTPLFLLVFPGWGLGLRRAGGWRTLCGLSLGLTLWVFGFYLSRTENYNYGGNTAGLRWTFWLIPLWLWSLIPALDAWESRRAFRVVTVLLLGVSAFSAAMPRDNPWRPPWLQVLMEDWGWVDYSTPQPEFPRRKIWMDPLPTQEPAEVELAGMSQRGPVRLILKLGAAAEVGGRSIREVQVVRTEGGLKDEFRLLLDAEAVRQGKSAEECLKHSGWGVAPWESLTGPTPEMLPFLRGMPEISKGAYVVREIRYLKVPARKDAFECRKTVLTVDIRPAGQKAWYRFRRDIWLSDEVPFGVVQVEDTISHPRDGVQYAKERLHLVRFSGGAPRQTAREAPGPSPGD